MEPLAMSNFAFNVDLDESLFNMTPPAGYTLQEVEVQVDAKSEPTEKDLIEGLRSTAALTDGHFLPELSLPAFGRAVENWSENTGANPVSKEIVQVSVIRELTYLGRLGANLVAPSLTKQTSRTGMISH